MATSVRLAPEMEERLDFLAKHTRRMKAYYLRELVERGMDALEDYYLSADVLERVRKGMEPVYSSSDVRKELGLDN